MLEIKEIKPPETSDLRHRILSPNKSVDSIILTEDDVGQHFGIFQSEKLVSVISLFVENDNAQFRKFATETTEQNKGYGSILLNHIIEESLKITSKTFGVMPECRLLSFMKNLVLK